MNLGVDFGALGAISRLLGAQNIIFQTQRECTVSRAHQCLSGGGSGSTMIGPTTLGVGLTALARAK